MGQRAPSSLIPRFTGLAGTLPHGLLVPIPIAEPPILTSQVRTQESQEKPGMAKKIWETQKAKIKGNKTKNTQNRSLLESLTMTPSSWLAIPFLSARGT